MARSRTARLVAAAIVAVGSALLSASPAMASWHWVKTP